MRMSEVNFRSPVFTDHPEGWQSPSDLVAGFTLAWALELKERMRLSPQNPGAYDLLHRLPARYRYDTLRRLIDLGPGATGAYFGQSPVVRLTTICGAWELFDLMNENWRIRPQDIAHGTSVMAYVTGGTERPSLYQGESADISKCLLAVRVRREFMGVDELDLAEQWFFTGDQELTFPNNFGHDCLLFHFSAINTVDLPLLAHEFVAAIWSTARVTVRELGPDRVIARHRDRVDSLSDLLERGGQRAEQAERELSPIQFRYFNNWPGWA